MSSSSLPGKIWHPFEEAGNAIWGGKDHPDAPAPPPPPPDPSVGTTKALQAQLEDELNIRRSMALVTGGQGVTGQAPTAGQTLVGM